MIINVTELFFSLSSLAAVMILPVVSFIMKSSPWKNKTKRKFSNKLTLLPRTAADNETITKLWYFCSKRNSEANLNSIYLLGFQATVQCTSQNIFLTNSPSTSKLVTSLPSYPTTFRLSTFPPAHLSTFTTTPDYLPYRIQALLHIFICLMATKVLSAIAPTNLSSYYPPSPHQE